MNSNDKLVICMGTDMKYADYPLFAEGFLNRFLKLGIYTKEQQFTKATLSGRVNEWLKRGFAIHENPCRKEFIQKRQEKLPEYVDVAQYKYRETVTVFDQEQSLHMYFPFGNIGVEESGFYYTPTHLRSYYYTIIKAEKEESVEFEISTCGGLTLWVNDVVVTDFTPFTRNTVKYSRIAVNLNAGENKFIICLDDLAERDTDYYFRIRRIGESQLTMRIPLDDETPITELSQMERMLAHIYFEKEIYISEPIKIQIRNYCSHPLSVGVTITPGEFIEKMGSFQELVEHRNYTLERNENSIVLLHSDEIRPGYYYFTLQLQSGQVVLKRKIGNQLVRKEFLNRLDESLIERKKRAIDIVLEYGVDNIYKSAILFHNGEDYEKAEEIILSEIDGIKKRKDCSDFHFIILIYIYRTFAEVISNKLKSEIEETMLNYRYWIDEPGDDVMWFFSENHALLFHVCQYLAGQYLPDKVFSNSGLLGEELHKKAIKLLDEWFESFFREFITEWNSSAYIPVDVLGIGTLYNLTPKGSTMHQKARKALDMIFYSLCVNEHKGIIMTSFGRTYEKELKGNYNAGTTSLLYVAYNAGFLNRGVIGYLPIILGDYAAPEEYREYLQISPDKEMIFQNTQGFEQHVNLYLYKNSDTALSTAVGFTPFKRGYQEHIVQAAINGRAQVFINHPGETHPYGSGRPNFWAGNGILPMAMQYENTSIIKYDIPEEHRIDYTHAYVPLCEFQQYKGDSYTLVLEKDRAYIGIKAMNSMRIQEEGPCRHREFISYGRKNVWVVRVARVSEYENLETFLNSFSKLEICLNDKKEVIVIDQQEKTYFIDAKNECYVNGEKIYQYPLTVEGRVEIKGE